jgi:CubicO group peptidase (beta-lactamase class C family)
VEDGGLMFADMDMPQHPGAALLVIDHDEIIYKKCYGLADLETQRLDRAPLRNLFHSG